MRTPTDHELPRGFPGGGFAVFTLGIKASRRKAARPDDTTRTPHYRGPGHTGERRCRMRGVGEMWISGRGETNIDMKMAATRRGEMASSKPIGGWVATTSSHIGRSVGVHDFVTRLRLFGARKLLFRPLSVGWLTRFGMPAGDRRRSVAKMGSRSIRSSVITDVAPAASAMTRRLRAPYSVGTECDNGAGSVLSERRPSRGRSAPPELKFETSVDR